MKYRNQEQGSTGPDTEHPAIHTATPADAWPQPLHQLRLRQGFACLLARLDPALHRLCGIGGAGVEADLRVGRLRAKPGADHYAVVAPPLEMLRSDGFGSCAQVDQATVHF